MYRYAARGLLRQKLKTGQRFRENGRFGMTTPTTRRLAPLLAVALSIVACQEANKLTIRRTRDNHEMGSYRVRSLTGIRDGEKLACTLVLGDKDGSLTMVMKFQVGVPTKLESGRYTWTRTDAREALEGTITAGAVSFQGGQDGPPSLGGTFELVGKDVDISLYQVKVPVTRMDAPERVPAHKPPEPMKTP